MVENWTGKLRQSPGHSGWHREKGWAAKAGNFGVPRVHMADGGGQACSSRMISRLHLLQVLLCWNWYGNDLTGSSVRGPDGADPQQESHCAPLLPSGLLCPACSLPGRFVGKA